MDRADSEPTLLGICDPLLHQFSEAESGERGKSSTPVIPAMQSTRDASGPAARESETLWLSVN